MNDAEKNDQIVKLVLCALSLLTLAGVYRSVPGMTPFRCLAFVLSLTVVAAIRKDFLSAVVELKKNKLFNFARFCLYTVAWNFFLFFVFVYFPFRFYTKTIILILLCLSLIPGVKIFFFPGKTDEKRLGFFRVLFVLSFVMYLLIVMLMVEDPITAFVPLIAGICGVKLARRKKADGERRRLFEAALGLSFFLCGQLLTMQLVETGMRDIPDAEEKAERKELSPWIRAIRDDDRAAIETLAKTGVNDVGEIGLTPLFYAEMKGDIGIVDMLIKAGADVNVKNEYGLTAVYYAISDNKVEIAQALIDAGAVIEPPPGKSLWALAWLSGIRSWSGLKIFALLWKNDVPFFIKGTTLRERLFFPFGLMDLHS